MKARPLKKDFIITAENDLLCKVPEVQGDSIFIFMKIGARYDLLYRANFLLFILTGNNDGLPKGRPRYSFRTWKLGLLHACLSSSLLHKIASSAVLFSPANVRSEAAPVTTPLPDSNSRYPINPWFYGIQGDRVS
jgi:hypothetical protein